MFSEDSSDDIAQVEALSKFEPRRKRTEGDSFKKQFKEYRANSRKTLASTLIDGNPFTFPTF